MSTQKKGCDHQTRWYFGMNYSVYFVNIFLFWILLHLVYSTQILIGLETCTQVSHLSDDIPWKDRAFLVCDFGGFLIYFVFHHIYTSNSMSWKRRSRRDSRSQAVGYFLSSMIILVNNLCWNADTSQEILVYRGWFYKVLNKPQKVTGFESCLIGSPRSCILSKIVHRIKTECHISRILCYSHFSSQCFMTSSD